jgi:hypothetical protein
MSKTVPSAQFPHPPHVGKTGNEFRIDSLGTAVHLTVGTEQIVLSGAEAREVLAWLNSCDLEPKASA